MASHLQKYDYEDERFEHTVIPSFHCPICLNVLKEPKMCRNNEHVFCSACITQHLANSSTCPQCMEELTVETLHRAPRVLINGLSELNISCDYFSRGCSEVIRLGDLQTHVISCGFAPVKCSNNDCDMEVNKRDKIYHETEVCDFRKVKCHDCGEMKKEIEGIKHQLNQLPEMKDQLNQLPEMKDQLNQLPQMKEEMTGMKDRLNQLPEMKDQLNQLTKMKDQLNQLPVMKDQLVEMKEQLNQLPEMKDQMKEQLVRVKAQQDELSTLKEDMKEVKAMMGEVLHKLKYVENFVHLPFHVNPTKKNILIAGGSTGRECMNSSAEKFSWNERAWAQLPPMKEGRQEASSFVYKNQIFVAGGYTGSDRTDTMEILKIDEHFQWTESPVKLPFKCDAHKTVVYQNSLIHIGGYNDTEKKYSDAISEVLLTPPYPKKLLCRMPQPRAYHGVEIFNDKILILGGIASYSSKDSLNSVLVYDVNKNKLKQMPSLPRAVSNMATVRWGDKVVVIGGNDKDGNVLSDVSMYDSKTGEINVLPSMRYERCRCTAIITGNVIVVMGGWNMRVKLLSSVELFILGGSSWEELPRMIQTRHGATAVLMPSTL